MGLYWRGDLAEADQWFAESAVLAPASGQWLAGGSSLAYRSLIAGEQGRLGEQRLLGDQATELVRERGIEQAVGEVTGLSGFELKGVMRTGTVASVDNRNWELGDHVATIRRLSQSRAIALDMESATIAGNGFRFRVPYGTLLCVSDKPLHGEIKLAGMAGEFYRQRIGQHLEIGLTALKKLKSQDWERLHSRKLRSFAEVAFQ